MASHFLKFLNNIDKGRQNLISALNQCGFDLRKDANLQEIATSIQGLNYQTNYPKDEEWVDWKRPDYLVDDPVKLLEEAPIYQNGNGSGSDGKMYPLVLFELDPLTTDVVLNNSSFTNYGNINEAIAFVTSDGAKYDLTDGTLFRHSDKTHTFSEVYGIKWIILYGTNYYTSVAFQNNWSNKYGIDLNDNISFLQQIKEIVIGNGYVKSLNLGAGSKENNIQSFIFSELYLPISELTPSHPSSSGCFEKMPHLEQFLAPGLKGMYFSASPNAPFKESKKLTHFNIENLENYSGSNGGYVYFPSPENDSGTVSSATSESERIPFVKLPKTQKNNHCGFSSRISRHFLDLREWTYIPTKILSYAYEVYFPRLNDTSSKVYEFYNAEYFYYEEGLNIYSLYFHKAKVLSFAKPCSLTTLAAYNAIELDLSGITFKGEHFGHAPKCINCIFPNNITGSVNLTGYYNLNKESLLDLFEKLPDRTDMTSLTVYINTKMSYLLTEDLLQIANDKNWTIQIS